MALDPTLVSTGLSFAGGLFGSKGKGAERAAKDAAARAEFVQEQARRQAQAALAPYQEAGQGASRRLSELLGVADPSGYAKRPQLQDFEQEQRAEHFRVYGKDYGRNSNTSGQMLIAKNRYEKALKDWEKGKAKFEANNPNSRGGGELLRNFTNEDFVQDPGYTFRMMEGEKGLNRGLLARGGFDSGAALKELNRFNQDYASNEFNQAYTRDAANKARTFGFLSGTAGQGLSAAGAQVGANQNAANNNTQIQLGLGNTLANKAQNDADNQNNLFQNTISNLLYGYERNRNNPYRTPDFNPTGSTVRDFNTGGTTTNKYYV